MNALNEHGIGTFDIVVVNLYPFVEKVTSSSGVTYGDAIDNIDVGGRTLVYASAKNNKDVLVIVDPEDYPSVLEFLQGKENNEEFRKKLAWKASQHDCIYSSLVSQWMWDPSLEESKFPSSLTLPLTLKSTLRYGENPHQEAAFYEDKSLSLVNAGGIGNAVQHHGKNKCMLGMWSGQPNRLESLRIAFRKAGDEAKGAVLASDAFFPFAWNDAVEEACRNGIAVIAEPGGSIRDGDAADCCNKYGVSLLFTNVRHFRH